MRALLIIALTISAGALLPCGCTPDPPVQRFRALAERGEAQAQYNLGVAYATGKDTAQDYVEAAKWFRQAAGQGIPAAMHNMGVCYHNGQGVEQNDTASAQWHRQGAERGDAKSQFFLGLYYNKGIGVEKNFTESVMWSRIAAERNEPSGQLLLGNCYRKGEGVVQDYVQALAQHGSQGAWPVGNHYDQAANRRRPAAHGRVSCRARRAAQQAQVRKQVSKQRL